VAQEVAEYENIGHIKLTIDESTRTRVVAFLNQCFAMNKFCLFVQGG